jgi:hypothetical protein
MAADNHLVDTGPVVAFIDARDRDHGWSVERMGNCGRR